MNPRVNRLLTGLVAGAAVSAIGMYILDPVSGRSRRASLRERTAATAANAVARFRPDTTTDQYLLRRLRSAVARAVSSPATIGVWADQGRVMLHGDLLPREHEPLVRSIRSLPGVSELTDHLREREAGDRISRAGGAHMPQRLDFSSERWSPAARALAGSLGVASLAAAVHERRSPLALLVGALGAGLIVRSVSNAPFKHFSRGRGIVDLHATLEVNAPVERVFRFFEPCESFPTFMRNVRSVTTAHRPKEMLAWRTLPDSHGEHWGVIRFEALGENRTRVDVRMSYSPPGGALGHALASVLGMDPRTELQHDLLRAKRFMETWKTAAETTESAGSAAPSPLAPDASDGRPASNGGASELRTTL